MNPTPDRLWRFTALALACALAVMLRVPALAEPFGRDTGVFACVAARMIDGGLPYRDVWDNKPPLVYAAYVLAVGAFGANQAGVYVVATVWTLLTMLVLWRLGTRLVGPWGGVAAAGMFGVFTGTPRLWGIGNGALAETFMALPIAGAMALTIGRSGRARGHAFAAGLLCGLAFWFKATAALPALVVGGAWLWDRDARKVRWSEAGLFAVGFIAPAFVLAGAACALGIGGYLWQQAFVYNFGRAAVDQLAGPYLHHAWRAFALEARFISAFLFLAGVGLIVVACEADARWSVVVLWLATGVVSYGLGGRFYPHYLIESLPAAALFAGKGVSWLDACWSGRRLRVAAGIVVAAATLALGVSNARRVARSHYALDWLALRGKVSRTRYLDALPIGLGERVSRWLAPALDDSDTVFAWGHIAELYVQAKRWPPVRFVYVDPIVEAVGQARERMVAELMRGLEARPPTFIVLADDRMPPEFAQFVRERYTGRVRVGKATIMRLR